MKTWLYFVGVVITTLFVMLFLSLIKTVYSPKIIYATQCGNFSKIPKIVHQTVATRYVSLPLHALRLHHARTNPSYTFILHDDKDQRLLMQELGGDFLAAYEALSIGVARADVWRLAVLYKHGGIYLDWKSGTETI